MENKKTILIVEDEESLASIVRDKLTEAGLATLKAKNGEEGLVVALREHPDLILLDILMPKMSGLAMLKKLREDSWGKDVQVMILTNLSGNGEVSEALDSKVFEYIVKTDVKIDEVVAKIKEKLGV